MSKPLLWFSRGKGSPLQNPVQLFPKSTGPTPVVVIWKGTVPGVVVGTCPHQWNCWDIVPPCNHTAGTITHIIFVRCAMDVQHLKDYSSSEGGKILWRSWQRGFKIWNWSDRSKWACDTWRTDTVLFFPEKKAWQISQGASLKVHHGFFSLNCALLWQWHTIHCHFKCTVGRILYTVSKQMLTCQSCVRGHMLSQTFQPFVAPL